MGLTVSVDYFRLCRGARNLRSGSRVDRFRASFRRRPASIGSAHRSNNGIDDRRESLGKDLRRSDGWINNPARGLNGGSDDLRCLDSEIEDLWCLDSGERRSTLPWTIYGVWTERSLNPPRKQTNHMILKRTLDATERRDGSAVATRHANEFLCNGRVRSCKV